VRTLYVDITIDRGAKGYSFTIGRSGLFIFPLMLHRVNKTTRSALGLKGCISYSFHNHGFFVDICYRPPVYGKKWMIGPTGCLLGDKPDDGGSGTTTTREGRGIDFQGLLL